MGLISEVVLIGVLVVKKLTRRLKVFTILVCYYTLQTILLYAVMRYAGGRVYFYAYWSSAIIDVLLQICLFMEGAIQIFRPTGYWGADIKRTLICLLSASVTLALALTWLAAPETKYPVQAVVIRGHFFSSVLISELFVAMVTFSVALGLPMNTYISRVLNGWGVYTIAGILIQGLQSYFGVAKGTETYALLSQYKVALYVLITIYWSIALWLPAPEPRDLPQRMQHKLLEMNKAMTYTLSMLRFRRRA